MGFILFITAILLTSIATAISMVITPLYYIFTFKWKTGIKTLNDWFYSMALGIDQFGNVANKETLKMLLTKKDGHLFGDEDDTVSYVIGRNKYKGKLSRTGKIIEGILHFLEKNHTDIAIEKKIKRDKEAAFRSLYEQYYK